MNYWRVFNEMNTGAQKLQLFRIESGRRLFDAGMVGVDVNNYVCKSDSDPTQEYKITLSHEFRGLQCDCKDFENRGSFLDCKHICAVRLYADMPLLMETV